MVCAWIHVCWLVVGLTIISCKEIVLRYISDRRDNNSSSAARCIDGSRPVYYMRPGFGEGISKWVLYFEGGGWCYDLESCFARSKSYLGSSKDYSPSIRQAVPSILMDDPRVNVMMYNWNVVDIKYCDGSSFAGDAVLEYKGKKLYFWGKRNRNALINQLLERENMRNATEIVISGRSAGALGVYLGIDEMSDQIKKHVRRLKASSSSRPSKHVRITGLADSGFFLSFNRSRHHSDVITHRGTGSDLAINPLSNTLDYVLAMRKVFQFTNMRAGVNQNCLKHVQSRVVSDCIFPEFLLPFVRTPVFSIQSQYDKWQLLNILGSERRADVQLYGGLLMDTMRRTIFGRKDGRNGAYIDSCEHHGTSCMKMINETYRFWSDPPAKDLATGYINPFYAFYLWYMSPRVSRSNSSSSSSASSEESQHLNSSTTAVESGWFVQDEPYPCESCCICATK